MSLLAPASCPHCGKSYALRSVDGGGYACLWCSAVLVPRSERIEAHEDTPLTLTPAQRERLHKLLVDELGGPVSARVVLERIEREV